MLYKSAYIAVVALLVLHCGGNTITSDDTQDVNTQESSSNLLESSSQEISSQEISSQEMSSQEISSQEMSSQEESSQSSQASPYEESSSSMIEPESSTSIDITGYWIDYGYASEPDGAITEFRSADLFIESNGTISWYDNRGFYSYSGLWVIDEEELIITFDGSPDTTRYDFEIRADTLVLSDSINWYFRIEGEDP